MQMNMIGNNDLSELRRKKAEFLANAKLIQHEIDRIERMNYEEDIKRNIAVIEPGDRVIYIPTHAEGNVNHPDCEYGIVKTWNDKFIFVNYVRNGIPQMTAQATRPDDLFLDAKGDNRICVLEIFDKIKDNPPSR